jgi:ArsR family transcriptional regulator
MRGENREAGRDHDHVAQRFDDRQSRRVSNHELPLVDGCEPARRTGTTLSAAEAASLAASFKAVADPTRLRLLSLIAAHEGGEACVCDLTGEFDLSGPTISHHLKVLREAGLVTSERRGTWVHYRVVAERLAELAQVLTPARPMAVIA